MEDFFKDQAKWLSVWQEQQQKLVRQYAQWGEDLTKEWTEAAQNQAPTNFEDVIKAQQDLFEQFRSFSTELQNNIFQMWGDKLPKELLQQFNFAILQEFYRNWVSNMKFPGGLQNPFMDGQHWLDPNRLFKSLMNQEHPFSSVFNNRDLTKDFQQLFGLLQGSKLPGGDLYSQLFTTYQGFFNQLANTGTRQGFDKLLESFAGWKDQADKYLLAPQVGIHRETAQDFSKAISLSFDYMQSFANMTKLMEETARKAGNRFQARLVERSLNNEPPIKFHDFCTLWTVENEAIFLDVFGSEEFAKTQKEFVSAQMRLKIQLNKLAEKALEQTPIALKSDIDLAAKEILQLKRDLRQSRKQQQQLKADAQAAQDAAAAAQERLQALEASLDKLQTLEAAKEVAESAEKRLMKLEADLEKVQTLKAAQDEAAAAEKRLQALEASLDKLQTFDATLEKIQAQVETVEKTAKSAIDQASKPATDPGSKPAAKTASKPAAKTASKPAAKTASKPAAKTASKPASQKPTAKKPSGTPTE
jgi:hypothetical protein